MTDNLTNEKRSWNMSRIRNRHSKPEIILRSLLHRLGYRFRIHDSSLPGCPDIVLPKHKTVIFVHGCFWHRHNCPKATFPSTNSDYWVAKFKANIERDKIIVCELAKMKWQVVVVWECQVLKDPHNVMLYVVSKIERGIPKEYDIDLDRKMILKLADKRSKYYLNKDN